MLQLATVFVIQTQHSTGLDYYTYNTKVAFFFMIGPCRRQMPDVSTKSLLPPTVAANGRRNVGKAQIFATRTNERGKK